MISKALVVGTYQRKLEEIAKFDDIELTLIVPPMWGETLLERVHTQGYDLHVSEVAFSGNFHLHYYPHLDQILNDVRPDIVHIDEEPYNLATFLALRQAKQIKANTVVFTWQNLNRRYPLPFRLMERYVLKQTDALIVGNSEALTVWQGKGYQGPIYQIPQFGVDPEIFYRHAYVKRVSRPSVVLQRSARRPSLPSLTIGYVGRLVEEKGVELLLQAVAKLVGPWTLKILGSGPERLRLERVAQWLGISSRVSFDHQLPASHMPNYLSSLDVLVLPSLTRSNWKEQFGRVLIEAMACEVLTVGARSGAIPEVIGDAGLLFEEGDVEDLRRQLQRLLDDAALRQSLRNLGIARVNNSYTQAIVAQNTVNVYRDLA